MKKLLISLIILFVLCLSFVFVLDNSTCNVNAEELSYYCLRDELYIPTANQLKYNTCWIFALTKCVETTLAKATNEYYDFSEAFIMLSEKYNQISSSALYGARGGDMTNYIDIIKNHGLLFEKDFPLEEGAYINNDNYKERYEYYSNFSDKEIVKNLKEKKLFYNETTNIKNHIKNHGAVNANIRSEGHAVTLIGWDDSINGGSFIVLNSYGNNYKTEKDGVYYLPYNETSDVASVWGFEYKNNQSELYIQNNPEYYIKIVDKYKNGGSATEKTALNKNLFYFANQKSIEYLLNESEVVENVKILEDRTINNIDFTQVGSKLNFTISSEDLLQGHIKVIIKTNKRTYQKLVVFVGDVEFENILFLPTAKTNQNSTAYANFNSINKKINIVSESISGLSYNRIFLYKSAYLNGTVSIDGNNQILQNGDKGFEIQLKDTTDGYKEYDLTITNGDYTRVYKIEYYIGSGILANIKYLNDGGTINPEYIFLNDTNSKELNTNANYLCSIKKEAYALLTDNMTSYELKKDDLLYSSSKNAFTKSNGALMYQYSLIIDNKYVDNEVLINQKNQNISQNIKYKESFSIGITHEEKLKDIVYKINDNIQDDINNVQLNAGKNEIKVFANYIVSENIEKPVTFTREIDIAPRSVSIHAHNKESKQNENLQELTYDIIGIYYDDLIVRISSNADKAVAGEYDILISCQENPNYIVTVTNGKYLVKQNLPTIKPDEDKTTPGNSNGETNNSDNNLNGSESDSIDDNNSSKNTNESQKEQSIDKTLLIVLPTIIGSIVIIGIILALFNKKKKVI